MVRAVTVVAVVALLVAWGVNAVAQVVSDEEKDQGFVALFNGTDLTGWHGGGETWTVENGVIVCGGKKGGYLVSDEQYGDFILRLDYKIAKGGNSGVFFRIVNEKDIVESGNEIQLLDSFGRTKLSPGDAGGLYGAVAPSKNAAKPFEEWNSLEITCQGTKLIVVLNGEEVVNCDLSDPDIKAKQPGGDKGKRGPKGYLALQNHGNPIEFRNLRIKVLTAENGE